MSDELAMVREQIAWWKVHRVAPAECLVALGYKIRVGEEAAYVTEWGRRLPVDWPTVERALRSALLSMLEERGAA